MGKLKPCPFCGGEAMIEVIEPHTHTMATFMPDYEGGAFIECQCGAAISGETRNAAIAAWNKRVQENPQPLTLDELREMDGEPVWTVGVSSTSDGSWGMWDIIEMVNDDGVCFGYSTERPEWWNYNIRNSDGTLCDFAWVAYRTKPEGSGK